MTKRLHVINQLLGDEPSTCQDNSRTVSLLLKPQHEMFPSLLRTVNFPIFVDRLLFPKCSVQKALPHIYSASSIKNTVCFLRRFYPQRRHPYKFKFSASVF